MGASYFEDLSFGKTPREAFNKAVEEARYEYGHAGYTGTIAEKDGFTLIQKKKGQRLKSLIKEHMEDNGKWAPAICFDLKGTKTAKAYRKRYGLVGKKGSVYMFGGWASY